MIYLIKFLIFGHVHKWNIVREIEIFEEFGDPLPYKHRYVCRCEKCGNMKTFKSGPV